MLLLLGVGLPRLLQLRRLGQVSLVRSWPCPLRRSAAAKVSAAVEGDVQRLVGMQQERIQLPDQDNFHSKATNRETKRKLRELGSTRTASTWSMRWESKRSARSAAPAGSHGPRCPVRPSRPA